jgi:DNA invertase Pin-like site-specific DNA recombinase
MEELMKIGYVRVSKQEQHEALQIDALKEAGCEKWFIDKMTGSKAERKGLDEALAYVRPGDTFVVWKLDRAGRSLTHLIELLKSLQGRGIEFISFVVSSDDLLPLLISQRKMGDDDFGTFFETTQRFLFPTPI